MRRPEAQYWSPFWSNPTITSFGNLFPSNYDGLMLEFWKRQSCGDLQRVVDLACGNGALTWIANDLLNSGSGRTRITGVDLAAIDPFKALGRRAGDYPLVDFIGSTAIERLPFEEASIDLVISQYGVEYSDLDKTIPEIGRVLKASGKIGLILHDKESVIVKGAVQHLDDFKIVADDICLHDLLLDLDALRQADKNFKRLSQTVHYQSLQARINEDSYQIRLILRSHPPGSPVGPYLERLWKASEAVPGKKVVSQRPLIEHARDSLRGHIERIEDLYAAALSVAEQEHLIALIKREGFTITDNEVLRYKDNDNFGTVLAAHRTGG